MKKSPSFLVLLLVLAVFGSAAVKPELSPGLFYLRIHVPADFAAARHDALSETRALVLDLRYVTVDEKSAEALVDTLARHPVGAPWFILVGPATPGALSPAITGSHALSLGIEGSVPAPKVIVHTAAVTDRRAYDALDAGTPVAALISGKLEKERFDEATLVQEFKNGNHDAEPPALSRIEGPPAADPTASEPATAPEKAPALIDRVLQRAVHLHQALLALRSRG
jgi:hypothetical protein